MTPRTYILAGGGTGGHLYPGLAVAERLRELDPGCTVVFACSAREIDRRILDPLDYAVVPQPVRPLPRGARGWGAFLLAWGRSVRLAKALVRDLRPAGVLGLGGFAAGPVVRQAGRAGIRTALLNPDAVPGKANRYLARRVDAVFTQFESTRAHFPPPVQTRVHAVGCPVRRSLLGGEREEALRHFDLREGRRVLVVNGGSLGARSVNEAVLALRDELAPLADAWQVLHITGRDRFDEVAGAWSAGSLHVRTLPYCERMDLAYAAADLIVGRSGASSVAELVATATPAVLVPYPGHRDRQQYLNAEPLVERGAAVVVEDRQDAAGNADAFRASLLPLLREPARLDAMRHAAQTARPSDAAGAVARWLLGSTGGQ